MRFSDYDGQLEEKHGTFIKEDIKKRTDIRTRRVWGDEQILEDTDINTKMASPFRTVLRLKLTFQRTFQPPGKFVRAN